MAPNVAAYGSPTYRWLWMFGNSRAAVPMRSERKTRCLVRSFAWSDPTRSGHFVHTGYVLRNSTLHLWFLLLFQDISLLVVSSFGFPVGTSYFHLTLPIIYRRLLSWFLQLIWNRCRLRKMHNTVPACARSRASALLEKSARDRRETSEPCFRM